MNRIFKTGIGPYTAAMAGKLYPYKLPRGGQYNAPLYNGCYDRKGARLGNLDPDLSCDTYIAANPGKAVFRLFLGYKISCTGGTVGGNCQTTQLLLNCEYKQVQVGTGSLESAAAATRYCSNESGILRNAQGSSTNEAVINGCSPGEDGSSYVPEKPCTKCAAGTFNDNFNPNIYPCKTCASVAPTPLPTGVLSYDGWTSPVGATSAGDCRPTGVKCSPGYEPSDDNTTCNLAKVCGLTLSLTPKNPSATASPNPPSTDGAITANVSGASGTATVSITQPSGIAAANAPNLPAVFTGLSANTYTVTAVDSACTVSAKVTLTEAASTPACSSCPAGSTQSGSNCVVAPTTSSSYSQYGYRCQGAGGCTSQPCYPTCTQGQSFGQVSASDSTPRTCDGGSLWTSFGGSCSMQTGPTTVPGSQSCPSGFSLVAGSCTMACASPASCGAGQYSPSGNGGDCTACPLGTFKSGAGNATACDPCPGAYIPNASNLSYTTSPAAGATASTSCSVTYSCPGGMAQGSNPAAYTGSAGYNNAFCSTVAPSPTPSALMLVYNAHSADNCTAAGGTVVQGPLGVNESFCKFKMQKIDPCVYIDPAVTLESLSAGYGGGRMVYGGWNYNNGPTPTLYNDQPGTVATSAEKAAAACYRYHISAYISCPSGWTRYNNWANYHYDREWNGGFCAQVTETDGSSICSSITPGTTYPSGGGWKNYSDAYGSMPYTSYTKYGYTTSTSPKPTYPGATCPDPDAYEDGMGNCVSTYCGVKSSSSGSCYGRSEEVGCY